jgi:hypothetical protein
MQLSLNSGQARLWSTEELEVRLMEFVDGLDKNRNLAGYVLKPR